MAVLLPIATAMVCVISFVLFLRDTEQQSQDIHAAPAENNQVPAIPTSVWVYSLICAALTVMIAVFFPRFYPSNSGWINIKRMSLLAIIWPIAYIDAKTYRIPNKFILLGLICRGVILIFEIFMGHKEVWITLLSEAIAAGALLVASLLCVLVVKNGIGFGDMKLFAVMGLLLGTEGIWGAIFMALIVSFFIAVIALLTKKKTRKDAIPFGPAIVIGAYLSVCLSGM